MTLSTTENESLRRILSDTGGTNARIKASSNYLKYRCFTALADPDLVLKFYPTSYLPFAGLKQRLPPVLASLNKGAYRVPTLLGFFSTPQHNVAAYRYLPGLTAFTLSWKEHRRELLSVLDAVLQITLDLRQLGLKNEPETWDYELSRVYEEVFSKNTSPRWLTHGDLNLGNITWNDGVVGFFDFDNVSFQKRDHILAQIALFFLMADGFEEPDEFLNGFNEVYHRSFSTLHNLAKSEFAANVILLSKSKSHLSLDPARARVWAGLSARVEKMAETSI